MLEPFVAPHWQRALEELAPRSEHVSWLKLRFEPEVRRFFVYQMYPAHVTPHLYLTEDQRYSSHLGRLMPDPRYRLSLDRRSVNESQWALFEETGCLGQAFWVIQGFHGGHKRHFNRTEQRILKLHKLPDTAPEPGSLPYAPLDARVIDKLAPLDTLRKYHRMLDFTARSAETLELDEEERAGEAHMMGVLHEWLATQVGEAMELV